MIGKATIDVIGNLWGGFLYRDSLASPDAPDAAYTYHAEIIPTDERFITHGQLYLSGLPSEDRESIASWLDTHAGDFERIIDFCAYLPDKSVLPWVSEENECAFLDAMYGED